MCLPSIILKHYNRNRGNVIVLYVEYYANLVFIPDTVGMIKIGLELLTTINFSLDHDYGYCLGSCRVMLSLIWELDVNVPTIDVQRTFLSLFHFYQFIHDKTSKPIMFIIKILSSV